MRAARGQTITGLKTLDVSSNRLTHASAAALVPLLTRAPPAQGLQELQLGDNQLRDAGAAALAQGLLRNSSLTKLSLGHNGVRAEGLRALAGGLALHRALACLWLPGNDIRGPAGCDAVRQLPGDTQWAPFSAPSPRHRLFRGETRPQWGWLSSPAPHEPI